VNDESATRDRARGALLGLAIGDALGMPTQDLPYDLVRSRYGVLTGFEPGPPDNEISRGMAAGRVTDDTDQAVIVGRLLVAGQGRLDPRDLADELLAWEQRMRAAGSLDLLGPSTRRALDAVAAGASPSESGRHGDTNGAAMRITPLGICCPRYGSAGLVERVAAVCQVTHDTGLAIAGASAVAAAVSAGVAGAGVAEALAAAVEAARLGAAYGGYAAGADVAARIGWAVDLVAGRGVVEALGIVNALVGTSVATQESVPAALALVSLMSPGDPWLVVRAAASLGGDSDTIAAMAGAVCGSLSGAGAFPSEVAEMLVRVNPELDLFSLADDLMALRDNHSGEGDGS
jgi:ADP-ribosylglycohydrolase